MQIPPFSLEKQLSEIGPQIDAAVLKVLRNGKYIGGSEVQEFEESFAEFVQSSYAVGCNSGTDALILALRALDIGSGDEVITTSFSFFATAEAISAVGARPVFVDVDPNNFLIDLEKIKDSITPFTKAILPVHLFGCPLDMERLMVLAKDRGLRVIEDCAQACGAKWGGKPVGGWGDIGCFSFFPTKNLGAAGDGGAAVTNDVELSRRMKQLSIHGMPRRYVHDELGYNSRLDAIQAAVLNVKLPLLSQWIQQRGEIAVRYQKALGGIQGIKLPYNGSENFLGHGWNQYVIRVNISERDKTSLKTNLIKKINLSENRYLVQSKLTERGVNTIIYYPIPIHLQPAYKALGYENVALPITEQLCAEVLSLPIFPEISLEEQNYVIDAIKNIMIST